MHWRIVERRMAGDRMPSAAVIELRHLGAHMSWPIGQRPKSRQVDGLGSMGLMGSPAKRTTRVLDRRGMASIRARV